MRTALKRGLQALAALVAFPFALLGRSSQAGFDFSAHFLALLPGLPGSYLRVGFYRQTLSACSPDCIIAFGSFCSKRSVRIGPNVSIGAYCVLGGVNIGAGTQIGSRVSLLGGRSQHIRDEHGRLLDGPAETIRIGQFVWVGEGSTVAANIGDRSTIGMGSVVVKPVRDGVIAFGCPAREYVPGSAQESLVD